MAWRTRRSEINRQAATLAREAREVAGQAVFVAGAVGPPDRLHSRLPMTRRDWRRYARSSASRSRRWWRAAWTSLILETFSSLVELRQAVLAAREVCAICRSSRR